MRCDSVTETMPDGNTRVVRMTELVCMVPRSMRAKPPYKVRFCVAESPDDPSATIVTSRSNCPCKIENHRCKHHNCVAYTYYAIQTGKFRVSDFNFGKRRTTKFMFEKVEQSDGFHFAPSDLSADLLLRLRRVIAPMEPVRGSTLAVQMCGPAGLAIVAENSDDDDAAENVGDAPSVADVGVGPVAGGAASAAGPRAAAPHAYARDEMAAADSMRIVDSFTSVIRDAPRTAHRPGVHRAGFLARLLNA
jgi:hypothetical protein